MNPSLEQARLAPQHAERLHKFAHDLRNRLAGLHQALKHVTESDEAGKIELIEYGEQQFFKALREVEGLLDDLGVERGEQNFEAVPVQLSEIVQHEAENLNFRFAAKGQELHLELDRSIEVQGDSRLIASSVAALLSNASKFSPQGTPIRVKLERKKDQAELCVIDQGVGLTEEDLKDIFVRYAWLGSRTTNGEAQGRSTLARADQWAKGMGGSLDACSNGAGKGCAFTLRLPLA
ncbi:MAG: HAMP domain-containing histidine kinase [Bacteroidota bacterium]|nr:HAMP domain-containing histidine kinase [Bacteroidota bacterium]